MGGTLSVASNSIIGSTSVTPDSTLHVYAGSAGSVTSPYTGLVVENSSNVAINLLSPDANTSSVSFGTPSDVAGAAVNWDYTNNLFSIGSDKAGASTIIRSGDGEAGLTLSGAGTSRLALFPKDVTMRGDLIVDNETGSNNDISIGTSVTGGGTNLSSLTINAPDYTDIYFKAADVLQGYVGLYTHSSITRMHMLTAAGLDIPIVIGANETNTLTFTATGGAKLATFYGKVKLNDNADLATALDVELTDNQSEALIFEQGANKYLQVVTTNSSEAINFGNTTTNPVYNFQGTGNVGIGTALPAYKLDVAGFINADIYSGYKQGGNTILFASSTNYAIIGGIGAGAGLLTDGVKNTAFGYDALSVATSSDDNTAFGYRALKANTEGYFNTAFGSGALEINTTGYSNVAVGGNAMFQNTTGHNNTAVGLGALLTNSTGRRNSAVGTGALTLNSSGESNAAFGWSALYNNDTGRYNAAVGTGAMLASVSGEYNSVLGQDALGRNISGSQNVAIGWQANYGNASATNTVAIGSLAGNGAGAGPYSNRGGVLVGTNAGTSFITGSDYNTFLGYNSGYNVSSGANNILIGASPTSGNENLTSGSGNIKIGYNISFPSTTANNQLNIGNLIYGTGLDGTGSTLSGGNIGIGTTSPDEKLDVNGNFALSSTNSALIKWPYIGDDSVAGLYWFKSGSFGTRLSIATSTGDLVLYDTTTGSPIEKIRFARGSGNITTEGSLATNHFTFGTAYTGIGTSTITAIRNDGILGDDALTIKTLAGDGGGATSRFTVTKGVGTYGNSNDIGQVKIANSNLSITQNGILTVSGTGDSYFAGNLGIGTSSPAAKLQVNGNSYFYHSSPGTNPGGLVIKENNSAAGGYPRMEIAGSNSDVWTIGTGIVISNHVASISVGSDFYGTGNLGAKVGWFGQDGIGNASNGLMFTADATNSYITSLKYASSPYPDLYVSAPNINFNTKSGAAWGDGSGGTQYGTTRMTITADGNVGIGTTTPGYKLTVDGNASFGTNSWMYLTDTGGGNGEINVTNIGSLDFGGGLLFRNLAGSAEYMTIVGAGLAMSGLTEGDIGIGTTTPTAQLHTTGSVRFETFGSGSLQTDANGNVSVSSDERLKDIVGTFDTSIEALMGIEPIQYHWTDASGFDTEALYTGFSAQNVQDFIPEAVGEDKKGFLTLSDRPLLATVINAIKEMWVKITGQDEKIQELELRIQTLEEALSIEPDEEVDEPQGEDLEEQSDESVPDQSEALEEEVVDESSNDEEVVPEAEPVEEEAGDSVSTEGGGEVSQ
jgi:hypothetical protein